MKSPSGGDFVDAEPVVAEGPTRVIADLAWGDRLCFDLLVRVFSASKPVV